MSSKGSLSHPVWFRWILLPLLRVVALVLTTMLGPFRWSGSKKVPRQGGLLVIANHLSDVDPVLTQMACPRPIHFMAESGLWTRKWLAPILNVFRAFPVDRGTSDRKSLRHAIELLKAGETVCLYPEGRVSPTGELLDLKPGLALIVRQSQCPVIALRIRGSQGIIPYPSTVPRPALRWVTAEWGSPKTFAEHASPEEILAWATQELSGR